jgi:capsular polysaccharide biosynthesis protein
LFKKVEIYPCTTNQSDTSPFFSNILPPVSKLISLKDKNQSPVFLFSLCNAYVSPYGVVFKNGMVIKESVYNSSIKKNWTHFISFCKKITQNKVKKINGDCIVITHSWYDNYYHWMIEIVPRLFLMKDELSNKTLIIHKTLLKFHIDVLSKFNFKEIVFIDDNELAKCENISFTSFPNYYTNQFLDMASKRIKLIELNVNYLLMREMSQWLLNNNSLLNKSTGFLNKKIYISRKKAFKRRIINELELEKMLVANGFVKVFLEDISFEQQVDLLNNSGIVIGCHGAGLANIIFMQPNTFVIDLINEHLHEFCYYTLASVANVNYCHVNCNCDGAEMQNPGNNDIEVNINIIQEILESIPD